MNAATPLSDRDSIDRPFGRLAPRPTPRVLVAGVGNVLRADDGFGPAVIRALESIRLPWAVKVVDVGIGGIGLVHELMNGYDALIIVDAVDRQGPPGTLYVLEPNVPDVWQASFEERQALATDTHQAVPGSALVLARAVGALPPRIRIVGCQPGEVDELSLELTPPVRHALPAAIAAIHELIRVLQRGDCGDDRGLGLRFECE